MPRIKPAHFQRLIYDGTLTTPSQVAVASFLAFRTFTTGNRHGWVQIDYRTIAEACRVSRATVHRVLARLRELGWIESLRVFENGRQQPSRYRLADPARALTESHHETRVEGTSESHRARSTESHHETPLRSNQRIQTQPPPAAGAETVKELKPKPAPVATAVPDLPPLPVAAGGETLSWKDAPDHIQMQGRLAMLRWWREQWDVRP